MALSLPLIVGASLFAISFWQARQVDFGLNATDVVVISMRSEEHVWALDDVFQPALRPLRLGAKVFVAFGLLALLIAGVGLAAVTTYGVTRRRRELAIRMALGAEPAELVLLTLRRSLTAAALGVAGGCLVAYGSSRWLTSVLYGDLTWRCARVCGRRGRAARGQSRGSVSPRARRRPRRSCRRPPSGIAALLEPGQAAATPRPAGY